MDRAPVRVRLVREANGNAPDTQKHLGDQIEVFCFQSKML